MVDRSAELPNGRHRRTVHGHLRLGRVTQEPANGEELVAAVAPVVALGGTRQVAVSGWSPHREAPSDVLF